MSVFAEELAISSYEKEGFIVIPNLVDRDDIQKCLQECDRLQLFAQQVAKNFKYSQEGIMIEDISSDEDIGIEKVEKIQGAIKAIFGVNKYSPFFDSLCKKINLSEKVVAPLLNTMDFTLGVSTLWYKQPKVGSSTPWHQDIPYADEKTRTLYQRILNVWIALDHATSFNGCLEFLPGSHLKGMVEHHKSGHGNHQLYLIPEEAFPGIDPVKIELEPGSAVVFNAYVAHFSAANHSSRSRRAITYSYLSKK